MNVCPYRANFCPSSPPPGSWFYGDDNYCDAGGPTLANYGVTGVLADPILELHRSSDGAVIAINDNWGTASNAAAITATGLAPANTLESAILITLQPGAYTAIVSGSGGGTGVGIVEVFAQ